MGKATADLPKTEASASLPAEGAGGPAPGEGEWDKLATGDTASADDLLAQLAAAEVDRLLRESEGGRTSTLPETDATDRLMTSPPVDQLVLAEMASQSAQQPYKMPVARVTADPEPESIPEPTSENSLPTDSKSAESLQAAPQPAVEAEPLPASEKIGDEQKAEVAAPVAVTPLPVDAVPPMSEAPPAPEASTGVVEASPPSAESPLAALQAEEETTAAEKQLLNESPVAAPPAAIATPAPEPLPADAAPEAPVAEESDEDDESQPVPLPIYLKPLEWLNAPLAHSPAPLRQLLGNIAVMTLLNAIAILIYVAFFRK